jgi:hypothetical protein
METMHQLRDLLGGDSSQSGIVMHIDSDHIEVASAAGLRIVSSRIAVKIGDQVSIQQGVITQVAAKPAAETWYV